MVSLLNLPFAESDAEKKRMEGQRDPTLDFPMFCKNATCPHGELRVTCSLQTHSYHRRTYAGHFSQDQPHENCLNRQLPTVTSLKQDSTLIVFRQEHFLSILALCI